MSLQFYVEMRELVGRFSGTHKTSHECLYKQKIVQMIKNKQLWEE